MFSPPIRKVGEQSPRSAYVKITNLVDSVSDGEVSLSFTPKSTSVLLHQGNDHGAETSVTVRVTG